MSDGTEFVLDISVSPNSISQVEKSADALMKLADQAVAAGAAASAAAQAVKAGEAAYRQAESGADRAAQAVERLGIKADEQRAKIAKLGEGKDGVVNIAAYQRAQAVLEQLTQRQVEAAARADAAKLALAAQAESVDRLRAAADAARATEVGLVKAHAESAAAAKAAAAAEAAAAKERESAAAKLARSQAAAEQLAAKEAAAAAKVAEAHRLATSGTGKVAEAAEAFAKLGGPVGLLGGKLLGAADGAKKLLGSLGTSSGLLAGAAIAIAAVVAAVVALGAATATAIGSVLKWSITLADKNKDIEKQTTRLRSNIDKIFSGLKIGGIVSGLSRVADLFDENSAAAKAIKVVFEDLFQPLVDAIANFIPKMISAFIQFEIWVLKALIAIKPFGSKIEAVGILFGGLAIAVGLAMGIVIGLFALAVAATLGVVAAFLYMQQLLQQLGEGIGQFGVQVWNGIVGAFTSVREEVAKVVDWLKSLSFADIGRSMIEGLVRGITGAGSMVLDSVKGVLGGAVNAAHSLLEINSPSKVFAAIGASTGEGMVKGVDGSAGEVQSSMESMVSPPDVARVSAQGGPASTSATAASTSETTASTSGEGLTIRIENLNIHGAQSDDPISFASKFEEGMRGFISSMLAQGGRSVPEPST